MKHLKKVMSLALVLALLIPSAIFANPMNGQNELNLIDQINLDDMLEKINRIVEENNVKPDIELNKKENEYSRIIVELNEKPAIEYATDKGIAYGQLSAMERSNIEDGIFKAQETVKRSIEAKNISMKYLRNFAVTFSGFSGIAKTEEIEAIKQIPGVKNVYISNEYYRPIVTPDMSSSHELIGSRETWNTEGLKYKGEGMVVAIIDTGVDSSHKDMKITEGTKVKLNETDIKDVPGKYFNIKVPYGYNYYDFNNEILDLGPDASEHGMHVAGTAAANGDTENGGIKGVAPEAQILAMKVFSNDPKYSTTFDDVYLAAIDDAIKLKADVLNMSLGSAAGFYVEDDAVNVAITKAVDNGIVCSISAGNEAQFGDAYDLPWKENPDIGLVGTPGLSKDSVQVASIENNKMQVRYVKYETEGAAEALPANTIIIENKAYDVLTLKQDKEGMKHFVDAYNKYFNELDKLPVAIKFAGGVIIDINKKKVDPVKLPATVEYRYTDENGGRQSKLCSPMGEGGSGEVEEVKASMTLAGPYDPSDLIKRKIAYVDCGQGTLDEFKNVDVRNKVALIIRGGCTFVEKIENAQNAGAAAVIVYNHADGGEELINMQYPETGCDIPAVFIGNKAGSELAKMENKLVEFPTDTIIVLNPAKGYMSDFTSWGTTPDLQLKPEITAPGGMIYSTLQNDRYGVMSGTSMAAPHVTGGSALVMQYIKAKYNDLALAEQTRLAKVLLMNTAKVQENPDSKTPYSPRRQGAGVMNINAAVTTPVRVINPVNNEAKVELKDFESTSFSMKLKAINDTDKDITYNISVDVLADEIEADKEGQEYITLNSRKVAANVSGDKQVAVPANGEKDFVVNVDFSGDPEIYRNMFIEGFVYLKETTDTHPELSVPYVGFYGDWNEPQILDGMVKLEGMDEKSYYGIGGMAYLDDIGEELYLYEGKVVISPESIIGTNNLLPVLSFLRNAENVEYNILDKDGNKLRTVWQDEYVRKNYFGQNQRFYTISEDSLWDGRVRGQYVEDGMYYYEIKSTINYPGVTPQGKRIPVYMDKTAPVISNVQYDLDKKILTWEATDGKGCGIQFFDISVNNKSVLEEFLNPKDVETKEENKYSMEIDLGIKEDGQYVVKVMGLDYAFNVGVNKQIVNVDTMVKDLSFDKETKKLSFTVKDEKSGLASFNIIVNNEVIKTVKPEDVAVEGKDNVYEVELNLDLTKKAIYNIIVEAVTNAGNKKYSNAYKVVIDNHAPYIYLEKPGLDDRYNSEEGNSVLFSGYVETNEELKNLTIKVGKESQNVEFTKVEGKNQYEFKTKIELVDNYYTAIVEAESTTGNKASISRLFYVDTTAPTLNVEVAEREAKSDKATMNITMSDNFPVLKLYMFDSLEYKFDGSKAAYDIKPTGDKTKSIEVPLKLGDNTFEFTLVDFAGNETTKKITILREAPTKEDLNAKIAEAEALKQEDYLDKTLWEVLQNALTDAKKIFNKDAATPEEIENALNNLTNAIKNLKLNPIFEAIEAKYGTVGEGENAKYVAYILFNLKDEFKDKDIMVKVNDETFFEKGAEKEGYAFHYNGMTTEKPYTVVLTIGEETFDITELVNWAIADEQAVQQIIETYEELLNE